MSAQPMPTPAARERAPVSSAPAVRVGDGERRRLVWVAPLALLIAGLLSLTPLHQRLSLALLDSQMQLALRDLPFDDVAVVDIDDASIKTLQQQLGPWPYRRDTYALLADYLLELGAKRVVCDIVFGDARDGDGALNRSIERSGRIVLAAGALRESIDSDTAARNALQRVGAPLPANWPRTIWPALTVPAASLAVAQPASGAVGVMSVQLDEDGRLRRMPFVHEAQGVGVPALPLAALQAAAPATALEYSEGRYRFGSHRWRVDPHGRVVLKLPAPEAVPTLAFARVAAAALGITRDESLRAAVVGRTVFVGSTAFLADHAITPRGPLPGTQVLAATTSALANDRVLGP